MVFNGKKTEHTNEKQLVFIQDWRTPAPCSIFFYHLEGISLLIYLKLTIKCVFKINTFSLFSTVDELVEWNINIRILIVWHLYKENVCHLILIHWIKNNMMLETMHSKTLTLECRQWLSMNFSLSELVKGRNAIITIR